MPTTRRDAATMGLMFLLPFLVGDTPDMWPGPDADTAIFDGETGNPVSSSDVQP